MHSVKVIGQVQVYFHMYVFIFTVIWCKKKLHPFSEYSSTPNICLLGLIIESLQIFTSDFLQLFTQRTRMWKRNTYFFWKNKSIQMVLPTFSNLIFTSVLQMKIEALRRKKKIYIYTHIHMKKWSKLHPLQVVVKRQH